MEDTKEFGSSKFINNSWKGCMSEVDLNDPRKIRESRNDYLLALGKIKIRKEILSNYHINIGDFSNILIGNVKKLVSNFFDKEKDVLQYEKFQLYLRLKKLDCVLEFNQS